MFALTKLELKWLASGVLALAILNALNLIAGQPFWTITKIIYLGFDNNFAAWYSSVLLLIAAYLSYECAKTAKHYLNAGHMYLYLFSFLLAFMAADELLRMHEVLGGYLSAGVGIKDKEFAQNSPWVWVGGPVVIALLAAMFYLLKPYLFYVKGTTTLLGLGFASIIVGGVFLESATNFLNQDDLKWIWDIEVIVEESLEMLGSILICWALLSWRDGVVNKAQNDLS